MKVMLQTCALLALVAALAFAAGWWWGRRPDPQLAAQLDVLRTTNRQLDSALAAYRAAGPAAATVIVHARAAAAQHDTATARLIDSVLVVAPDTLWPVLARIRLEHQATVAGLTIALDSLAAAKTRADALLAESERLRAANLVLADQAVHHNAPHWITLVFGGGATYAGGRVVTGPSLTVGVRVPL